jgi:hypothetical protein
VDIELPGAKRQEDVHTLPADAFGVKTRLKVTCVHAKLLKNNEKILIKKASH